MSFAMLIDNLSVPDASCDHTRHLKIDLLHLPYLRLLLYHVVRLVFSLASVLHLRTPPLVLLRFRQPLLQLHLRYNVPLPIQHGPGSH